MLIQFSVENHRSIKENAVISFAASKDKSLEACSILTRSGRCCRSLPFTERMQPVKAMFCTPYSPCRTWCAAALPRSQRDRSFRGSLLQETGSRLPLK